MKKNIAILYLIALCVWGCQKVDVSQEASSRMCKLIINLNATIESFDSITKSSNNSIVWIDGTKLFLNFSNDGESVTGIAQYNAEDDVWTLTYNGNLNLANKASVSVYYFTEYEISSSNNEVILSHESAIYSDTEGTYSYLSDGELRVIANLTPSSGRIRFKGEPDNTFLINGISANSAFNILSQETTYRNEKYELRVDDNGYTSYIYGTLAQPDNKLLLYHQYCLFEKQCSSNVLMKGKSGYMDVPSLSNYVGWELIPIEPTVKTISPAKVDYISTEATLNGLILGNGGDEIIECGFLFGTDLEKLRTLNISTSEIGDFSQDVPVSGDSTYFYRAYAKNNQGVGLGDIISFKPKSDYPEVTTGYDYKINTSRMTITISGEVDNLNNSGLLDYGFEVSVSSGYNTESYHYSVAHNTYHYVYYEGMYSHPLIIDIPYDFTYTIQVNRTWSYPYVKWRAYVSTVAGFVYGEEMSESFDF